MFRVAEFAEDAEGLEMHKTRPKNVGLPAGARRPRSEAARKVEKQREPQWAAWTSDLSRIVAYGATLEEARDSARALGEAEPALEPVQSRHRLA